MPTVNINKLIMFNSDVKKLNKTCFSRGKSGPGLVGVDPCEKNFISHNTFGNHIDAVLSFDFARSLETTENDSIKNIT